jgi:hypothetical protein
MTWTKNEILELLNSNDLAVCRAILAIDNLQTDEERLGQSAPANGCGWSRYDAPFMSSLASQYRAKGRLSKGQVEVARRKVARYWRQLAKIANAKEMNACRK